MAEAILLTLRETWSGYVEGLRLVIPRLLAMLSVGVAGWAAAGLARAAVARALGWLRVARLAAHHLAESYGSRRGGDLRKLDDG